MLALWPEVVMIDVMNTPMQWSNRGAEDLSLPAYSGLESVPANPSVLSEQLVHRIVTAVVEEIQPWLNQMIPSTPAMVPQSPVAPQPHPDPSAPPADSVQLSALQAQIDLLQLREEKLRQQIRNYELEIDHLLQENATLDQLIQELPEIYRQKFMARIAPIQERIRMIQQENLQLKAELYTVNYHLSLQSASEDRQRRIHLPRFARPQRAMTALPSAY